MTDAYINDGYVYCMSTSHPINVKIGMTKFNRHQSMDEVESGLLCRYSTYYGHDARILYLIRVGDAFEAEKLLKRKLKDQHVSHELYRIENDSLVREVFEQTRLMFPTLMDMLGKITSFEERIKKEMKLNLTIRALDLQLSMQDAKRKSVYLRDIMGQECTVP